MAFLGRCLHCGRQRWIGGRGLCSTHHADKAIRGCYPLRNVPRGKFKIAPCKHCQRTKRVHARGLCGTCYLKPEIRNQYDRVGGRPYRLRREAS